MLIRRATHPRGGAGHLPPTEGMAFHESRRRSGVGVGIKVREAASMEGPSSTLSPVAPSALDGTADNGNTSGTARIINMSTTSRRENPLTRVVSIG